MDWHPATVSRRGNRQYISVTVPPEAVEAVGRDQIKKSARTTDRQIAERRKHDIEAQIRHEILEAVARHRAVAEDSAYQRAVNALRLRGKTYTMEYDAKFNDVFERHFEEPPRNESELRLVQEAMSKRLEEYSGGDIKVVKQLLERHQGQIPDRIKLQEIVDHGLSEARAGCGIRESVETLNSFLPQVEIAAEEAVERGTMKRKSARQRAKHIRHFISVVGDLELREVTARHAYEYAEEMSDGYGNSTIKSRISDVRILLDQAVKKGLLPHNPFIHLKLTEYGKRGRHYDPLNEAQLVEMFSAPAVPLVVKRLWAILICTGMRLDEAATLRPKQVKENDQGVRYFDLRHAAVKNEAGKRRVPISATLEPLVDQLMLERADKDTLFDFEVNDDGKTSASRLCVYWMGKLDLARLGDNEDGWYVTHSLRGTCKDKFRDAGVSPEVSNWIHGHDLGGVSRAYGHGPSLSVLREAVDKLKHPYLAPILDEIAQRNE
ncbi:DUF6538 domain-containing protein [Citreimonas salinaria]|uniref:Phage integrase family protein n=1 Tax=Citreimonas salinaria TaxID=321339 RepID=A0A1H3NZX3_9RHOB|nr:phage integrase SAM-like domain-containing protein [Citreimonas salinaria]SDY93739.1 hypothetical protein SAMN05444340_1378 [Citreimonas salinaria]